MMMMMMMMMMMGGSKPKPGKANDFARRDPKKTGQTRTTK